MPGLRDLRLGWAAWVLSCFTACGGGSSEGVTPTPSSLGITRAAASARVGAPQAYTATATYADGSTRDVTALASWSSSDVARMTVATGGVATGPMAEARAEHTATLLADGRVLLTGGDGADTVAEFYDAARRAWVVTGALRDGRLTHTTPLMPDGTVRAVGGWSNGVTVSSLERYDPASGTWTAEGALAAARSLHTATLPASGQLLVAGGYVDGVALMSSERLP